MQNVSRKLLQKHLSYKQVNQVNQYLKYQGMFDNSFPKTDYIYILCFETKDDKGQRIKVNPKKIKNKNMIIMEAYIL